VIFRPTVTFRPTGASGQQRFLPLLVPDPVTGLTPDTYRLRVRTGEYRPEWTWIAEDQDGAGGAPLAVAAWWGRPGASYPASLDCLCARDSLSPAERTGVAVGLLTAAHDAYARAGAADPPDYHIFLPGDWRDRPGAVAALAWREEAARQAGLVQTLERLRYEWTPGDGLPAPSRRLVFRPEPDDEVFAGLAARVLAGTLDATSRKEAEAIGPEAQGRRDIAFYRDQMRGKRSWWRVAETPGGEVAGFGIPSRNTEVPVIGYLGVLPGHRGKHYADDILAELTRILVAEAGATAIQADTDLANGPMAASFERTGYRNFGRRLVLSAH
jgi:RimJ/RimL family protein N-acetyltransferase